MITHVVQPGDSMYKIAKTHGISLDALLGANPGISDPSRLSIGQIVQVPTGAGMGMGMGMGTGIGIGTGMNAKEKMTMPKPMATAPMNIPAPPPMTPPPVHMMQPQVHVAPAPMNYYAPHVDLDVTYQHQEIIEQQKQHHKRPPYYIKCCVPHVDAYGNVVYKEVIYYPAGERVTRSPY